MVPLVVGVLDGPSRGPVLRVGPQGLVHGLSLVEAPVVQLLHSVSHGHACRAADDEHGAARLARLQRVVQAVHERGGRLGRNRMPAHLQHIPLLSCCCPDLQSFQPAMLIHLTRVMAVLDLDIRGSPDDLNIAMLDLQRNCRHARYSLPVGFHGCTRAHQQRGVVVPTAQRIEAQHAVDLASHVLRKSCRCSEHLQVPASRVGQRALQKPLNRARVEITQPSRHKLLLLVVDAPLLLDVPCRSCQMRGGGVGVDLI
mmetsp:Transcript_15446/g.24681  ORF Transcript_15446/g.24681 Transcript_15446/m.24681 type:complete len:256 (-) Transcript_15446:859-1626(-)